MGMGMISYRIVPNWSRTHRSQSFVLSWKSLIYMWALLIQSQKLGRFFFFPLYKIENFIPWNDWNVIMWHEHFSLSLFHLMGEGGCLTTISSLRLWQPTLWIWALKPHVRFLAWILSTTCILKPKKVIKKINKK